MPNVLEKCLEGRVLIKGIIHRRYWGKCSHGWAFGWEMHAFALWDVSSFWNLLCGQVRRPQYTWPLSSPCHPPQAISTRSPKRMKLAAQKSGLPLVQVEGVPVAHT